MQAKAGFDIEPIDQTDTGANRLIYYYDEVGRDTFIQLTNTSDEEVCVHVQIFNATLACEELDFFDCLTPGDTDVYDMSDLPAGIASNLVDTHGFVAISLTSGPEFSLIGMFRILDNDGDYEYRTNAAWSEDPLAFFEGFKILNFNDVNGNEFSDVVGITYVDLGFDQVFASPLIGTLFGDPFDPQNFILDDNEIPTSCSPVVFTCDDTTINYGIDNSIPNSQGFDRICNTNKLDGPVIGAVDSGWLFLPFINFVCFEADLDPTECPSEPFFVGFLGINNGNGTGSMDSWMSFSVFTEAVAVEE
ncbi:MAG: hypothetical protein AB1598_13790 [Thermodesulfobacteriota bacterium]